MATILLTRPDGMWTGRIVGPRELSDGMGVDPDLGGFVTGWGSDGRTEHGLDMWIHADACGCMGCMGFMGWMAMAGRHARVARDARAMAGECRRV